MLFSGGFWRGSSMAALSQTWSVLSAVTLLLLQLCAGKDSSLSDWRRERLEGALHSFRQVSDLKVMRCLISCACKKKPKETFWAWTRVVCFPRHLCFTLVGFTETHGMNASSLLAGENSCVIWSTAGSVVQRGSSFKVYSSFKCECKGKGVMCSDHPATGQGHQVLNSTTIYFNVVNISMSRTYSCQCDCPRAPDSCGMDIYTGCECEKKNRGRTICHAAKDRCTSRCSTDDTYLNRKLSMQQNKVYSI